MASEQTARSAAILGTGIMGAAMARNIAAAGLATAAWNRHREAAEPLAADGIEVFDEPAEAVRGRDAVITMLPDAAVVRAVMSADVFDAMDAEAVWIQASTVGVDGIEDLIVLAGEHGARLLDAPVSGTKGPAEEGTLIILASGDEPAAEFCRPILDAVGAKTVWLGAAGNGSRMKLVSNDWVLGVTALVAEALRLCETLGLGLESFIESLEGTASASPYALAKGRMMIEQSFPPNFPLEHGAKDTRLIMQVARDADIELPLAAGTAQHFAAALDAGLGKQDVAAIYERTAR